jgi:hypothetical protein
MTGARMLHLLTTLYALAAPGARRRAGRRGWPVGILTPTTHRGSCGIPAL